MQRQWSKTGDLDVKRHAFNHEQSDCFRSAQLMIRGSLLEEHLFDFRLFLIRRLPHDSWLGRTGRISMRRGAWVPRRISPRWHAVVHSVDLHEPDDVWLSLDFLCCNETDIHAWNISGRYS